MPNDLADFLTSRKPSPERPLAGQTLLVVEDSRFACEALRLLSQRSGARIRRADSLRSARRHLQAFRPSVVIVDMGLPDGSGADLIAELAAARPRINAIIGMSGDDGAAEHAMAAGADAFLAKPIATLGQFQSVILGALPSQPVLLRSVPTDSISPDRLAVRDDLSRVAGILRDDPSQETVGYAAQFLAGLAVLAGDAELKSRAQALRPDGVADMLSLLEKRIAQLAGMAA